MLARATRYRHALVDDSRMPRFAAAGLAHGRVWVVLSVKSLSARREFWAEAHLRENQVKQDSQAEFYPAVRFYSFWRRIGRPHRVLSTLRSGKPAKGAAESHEHATSCTDDAQ